MRALCGRLWVVLALSGAVVASVSLGGCGRSGAQAGGGQMPPPTVGVVTVQAAPLALTREYSGRLEPWRLAQVRARVSGIVQKRLFAEGAEVREGQLLFQLDDGSLRSAVEGAQAQQARAEATLAQVQALFARNQVLAEQKAISQQEWVNTQAQVKQAEADLALARAALGTARINLGYSRITAPISGRVGRTQVTEGALVGPADAAALVTVQQMNPLYLSFSQPASEVLALERAFAEGRLQRQGGQGGQGVRVQVLLDDGREYPLPGKLLFADKSVDPSTGQVSLRAELPNPKGVLMPGLFVRVRLAQASSQSAMLLPQQAVTRASTGDTVLVVGADRKVTPRTVTVGGVHDGQWVVESGLQPGEQVVVDGVQKLMMAAGAAVNPVPWTAAGAASAAAPVAASAAASAATAAPASAAAPAASR